MGLTLVNREHTIIAVLLHNYESNIKLNKFMCATYMILKNFLEHCNIFEVKDPMNIFST
jgi:hypothetical protein